MTNRETAEHHGVEKLETETRGKHDLRHGRVEALRSLQAQCAD
jgi:hypothetical protein